MSWKESKVRVLTHQSGLQGLQVLSAESKKPSDIQDVFLLQPSNSGSTVPVHPATASLSVGSAATSSSSYSLASVKFKSSLPPPSSSLQQQQQQSDNKSLVIQNLPSDVSCVPLVSSNTGGRSAPHLHQFQIQDKPPSISSLLNHHPLPATANIQQVSQQNLPVGSYRTINTDNIIKTEQQALSQDLLQELSQNAFSQLPRSTTLTPALSIQQPNHRQIKEESSATITLASILAPSLSIIPTSTSTNHHPTRLDSPSSPQTCVIEATSNGSPTELMPPPPPPPPPHSHSRNSTSPSTNVSSTSEEAQEGDIGKKSVLHVFIYLDTARAFRQK